MSKLNIDTHPIGYTISNPEVDAEMRLVCCTDGSARLIAYAPEGRVIVLTTESPETLARTLEQLAYLVRESSQDMTIMAQVDRDLEDSPKLRQAALGVMASAFFQFGRGDDHEPQQPDPQPVYAVMRGLYPERFREGIDIPSASQGEWATKYIRTLIRRIGDGEG